MCVLCVCESRHLRPTSQEPARRSSFVYFLLSARSKWTYPLQECKTKVILSRPRTWDNWSHMGPAFQSGWRWGNWWKWQPQFLFTVTNTVTFQKINNRRDDQATWEINLRVIGQEIGLSHTKNCTSEFHALLLINFNFCISGQIMVYFDTCVSFYDARTVCIFFFPLCNRSSGCWTFFQNLKPQWRLALIPVQNTIFSAAGQWIPLHLNLAKNANSNCPFQLLNGNIKKRSLETSSLLWLV